MIFFEIKALLGKPELSCRGDLNEKRTPDNTGVLYTLRESDEFVVKIFDSACSRDLVKAGGGGLLPYMGYIGLCDPKGYGFSAVLAINRVSILADFGHFGHK